MKRILIALILAASVSACGTLDKTTKSTNEVAKTENTTKVVETKTITEKADTIVSSKSDTLDAKTDLQRLLEGDTLEAETDFTSLTVTYDPETKTINATAIAKPQFIPVEVDRTITVSTETSNTLTTEIKKEEHEATKERKSGTSTYLFGVVSAFLLLILLYLLYRFIRSRFP